MLAHDAYNNGYLLTQIDGLYARYSHAMVLHMHVIRDRQYVSQKSKYRNMCIKQLMSI